MATIPTPIIQPDIKQTMPAYPKNRSLLSFINHSGGDGSNPSCSAIRRKRQREYMIAKQTPAANTPNGKAKIFSRHSFFAVALSKATVAAMPPALAVATNLIRGWAASLVFARSIDCVPNRRRVESVNLARYQNYTNFETMPLFGAVS